MAIGAVAIICVWLSLHDPTVVFSMEPKFEGQTISYWIEHWYKDPTTDGYHAGGNIGARLAIRTMGSNAVPYLVKWISGPVRYSSKDDYHDRALEAFKILGPVAKPAIPDLIEIIGENGDYAARALSCIGRDAVPALSEKLLETLADTNAPVMNWRDPRYRKNFFHVQASIVRCLRGMGTNAEAAMPALIKALKANHGWMWEDNPYAALMSVGQGHLEIVIPALIDSLTNSASPALNRGAIAKALSTLGTNHADATLPPLITSMGDARTDDRNRRAIASALAIVGRHHPEAVVPVLAGAFTNTATEYRDGIAAALGEFGDAARPVLPALQVASRNPYSSLRLQSAVAIKRIAPNMPESLAPLIRDLESSELGNKQQTIYALERLGTNAIDAVPALMKCLSHPNAQTRTDATRCLRSMGVTSDEFIALLGQNLSHTNHFVSDEALSTLVGLARSSKAAFVTALRVALGGPVGRDVRQQAKYGLINVSRVDPTFLVECLDDSDSKVRSGALKVFYDLARGVPASIPKLQRLATSDPDGSVKSLAADVLRMQQQ